RRCWRHGRKASARRSTAPRLYAPFQLESDQGAVAALEIGVGPTAGLPGLQAGEDDMRDVLAVPEEVRDRDGVLVVLPEPQRQSLEALQKQEGVEGRERRADVAQKLDAGAQQIGDRPERLGGLDPDRAVIGVVGLREQRK